MPLGNKTDSALMVSSAKIFQREHPFIENIPDEIDSRKEYYALEERKNLSVADIYGYSKEFLLNFKDETENIIENFDKTEMENFEKSLVAFSNKMSKTDELKLKVMEFNKEKILENINNPSVLFSAYKHCMLAKKAFDEIRERAEEFEEGIRNLKKSDLEKVKKEHAEFIQAGVFLAAEPFLVFSVFEADRKKDLDFTIKYTEILDQVTFTISRNAPEVYKEAVNFKQDKFKEGTFDKLLEKKQKLRSKVS